MKMGIMHSDTGIQLMFLEMLHKQDLELGVSFLKVGGECESNLWGGVCA